MNYKFSLHALEQLRNRGINKNLVNEILNNPESVVKRDDCLDIYQKIVIENKKKYLFRVFINKCKKPFVIITAYKTSKITKYED